MNRALETKRTREATRYSAAQARERVRGKDWRRKMSDNVAWALLVYTGLQIFLTVHVMRDLATGTASLLPYIALAILVVAIIPACRRFERRWTVLSDEEAGDPSLRGAYRQDQILLWALAIGLPLAITGLLKAGASVF